MKPISLRYLQPFGKEASKIIAREVNGSNSSPESTEQCVFAAGCFWGVELAFQRVPGVIRTEVGYTQGK